MVGVAMTKPPPPRREQSSSAIAPLPAVEAAAAEWNSLRSEYSADYTLTD